MDIASTLPALPFTNPVLIFFIVLTIILFAPLLTDCAYPILLDSLLQESSLGHMDLGYLNEIVAFNYSEM